MTLTIRHLKTDVLPDVVGEDPKAIQPSDWIADHVITGTLDGGSIDGFTAGYVPYADSDGTLTENANLTFDDVTNTLSTQILKPGNLTNGTVPMMSSTGLVNSYLALSGGSNIPQFTVFKGSVDVGTDYRLNIVKLDTVSTSGGDITINLSRWNSSTFTPITTWMAGLNTSDLDKFKLAYGTTYGLSNGTSVFEADTSGNLYFPNYTTNSIPFIGSGGLLDEDDQFQYFGGSSPSLRIYNQGTSSTNNATVQLVTETTGGDPRILFTVNGASDWTVGSHNDAGDIFVIANSASLAINNFFAISPSGDVSFSNQFIFDVSEPQLRIGSSIGTFDGISIGNNADTDIRVGQSSSNNVILGWKYNATASSAYAILECFGGSNTLAMQTAGGTVAIGSASGVDTSAKLHIIGTTNDEYLRLDGANSSRVQLVARNSATGTSYVGCIDSTLGLVANNSFIAYVKSDQFQSEKTITSSGTHSYHYQVQNVTGGRDINILRSGTNISSETDRICWEQFEYLSSSSFRRKWWMSNDGSSTQDSGFTLYYTGGQMYAGFNGEDSPSEAITLASGTVYIKSSGNLYINNNDTSSTYFRFHQNSSIPISVIDSSSALWFRFGSGAGTNTVQMSSSGMTMFSASLDTNIVFQLPNNITQQARAYAWNTYSARWLKTDIEDMPSQRVILNNLRTREFCYKGHWSDGYTWVEKSQKLGGFIADEVEPHLSWLCTYDEMGRPNGLDYAKLTPVLVKGWQEHEADIISLGSQIEQLQQRITALEALKRGV